jgi:hypothetical protein
MPLLRTLTTKIKTAISPSSSPATSPTSPQNQTSSFEVVGGRKEGGITLKRPETHFRMDSFMTDVSNTSKVDLTENKQRRISRFREELDAGDD